MKAQALALVRGLRFQRPRAPGPAFSPSRPSPMGLRGGKKFLETTCAKAGRLCALLGRTGPPGRAGPGPSFSRPVGGKGEALLL